MIELIYHKGKMLIPESFEECSGKQFMDLAALVFKGGDEMKCKVNALRILCGLNLFKFALVRPEVTNNALPYIEWVFDKEKEYTLTRQLITSYRGYYGPVSAFDNLRMKEFHMSERYFTELLDEENKDPEGSLNNLVAVLYRKPKLFYNKKRDRDGDIRKPFNHNTVSYYSKKIARWPLKVKQAIFIWYAGCRKELEDNNPAVFTSDSDFKSDYDTGMYGTMRSLAGDKLGPVEKIEEMYVHTALLEIGLIKEEERYYEEKMKASSKSA